MAAPKEYETKIHQVLGNSTKLSLKWNTVPEAKLHIAKLRQMQQQLRLIKKEIGAEMKSIRSVISNQKARVGSGLGTIVYGVAFGKKSAGKLNAAQREDLRIHQNKLLAPYQALSHGIDAALIQIDQLKLTIETWIQTERQT